MSKILIIDNELRDAQRITEVIQRLGLEVTVAPSGPDAHKALCDPCAYECCLLFWEIPGPPFGTELLQACRSRREPVPTIVMSGYLDATMATRAFALGARDFLQRPLDLERVRYSVVNLIRDRHPVPALVDSMGERILGSSNAMLEALMETAKAIEDDTLGVLLQGESGTGKELFAREIHRLGRRNQAPWLAVNVAAIPSALVESALFGHEKGAFTGAGQRQVGYLEEAGNGVLFLDEIGDLPQQLQVKLLRVLQEREFRRLGSNLSLPFQARVVTATHQDLATEVQRDAFRRDLYHRIREIQITIPPLRQRPGDIDELADHFLAECNQGRPNSVRLSREARSILRTYSFPGNVRELRNMIRSAVVRCSASTILPMHFPMREMGVFLATDGELPANRSSSRWPKEWLDSPYQQASKAVLQEFGAQYFQRCLDRAGNNMARAARLANLDVKTMRKHLASCGLRPRQDKE